MGKIAEPGVNYCDGEGTASLSVNGDIVSTQNPPISYTLSGTIATVSDALGVVGTFDLSGALIEVSRQVASPNTPYCGGNAKSVLKWDTGFIESNEPPISYSIEDEIIAIDLFVQRFIGGAWQLDPTVLSPSGLAASGILNQLGTQTIPTNYKGLFVLQGNPDISLNAGDSFTVTRFHRVDEEIGLVTIGGVTYPFFTFFLYGFDNVLIVSDSTGVILTETYRVTPVRFQAICYDYDISEVSYACTGCPSGTLFECTCPATNTKYCYGFDPDNPDVFKPLFESPIA